MPPFPFETASVYIVQTNLRSRVFLQQILKYTDFRCVFLCWSEISFINYNQKHRKLNSEVCPCSTDSYKSLCASMPGHCDLTFRQHKPLQLTPMPCFSLKKHRKKGKNKQGLFLSD